MTKEEIYEELKPLYEETAKYSKATSDPEEAFRLFVIDSPKEGMGFCLIEAEQPNIYALVESFVIEKIGDNDYKYTLGERLNRKLKALKGEYNG